jgi:IS5 family transposase
LCSKQWYGLADAAVEDAFYDSQALRGFAGVDLNRDPAPDAATVPHFRHWQERLRLTKDDNAQRPVLDSKAGGCGRCKAIGL